MARHFECIAVSWLGRHSSPSLIGLCLLSAAYMLDERIHTFKLSCVLAHLSNGCLPASERFATAAADSRLAGLSNTRYWERAGLGVSRFTS